MAEMSIYSGPPVVSVIVPARNEEANLEACLKSLVEQVGVRHEIIVVNDHSEDRTAEIAQSFPGVRVVDADPVPPGWSGKNNALATGVKKARGVWFLFTDADTIHLPGSLSRSLAEAIQRKADLLSFSPEQIVVGWSEKLVMAVIFSELATSYPPSQVSNPKSRIAAANGQYILISRKAYESVGGHVGVADSLLEDVALARGIKSAGYRISFRYGGDAVKTRMYRSFAHLRDGWTKNLVLLFPAAIRLAALRLIEFLLIIGTAGLSVRAFLHQRLQVGVVLATAFAILYGMLLRRTRRAHFGWRASVLSVFGLPVFSYLLMRSRLAHATGIVNWKGRTYGADSKDRPASRADSISPEENQRNHGEAEPRIAGIPR
ncbi:MAG TPA: glycosyltransferase [Terriglobales bacterium]|jgi:glycosyltransferase involved in cell wall biosynthesis